MKTRSMINSLQVGLVALFLMVFTVTRSQVCPGNSVTLTMANPVLHASDVEVDIYVTNSSATNTMKLASVQGSITPTGMSGTITGSWITQPTNADFPGHQNAGAPSFQTPNIRWTNNPAPAVGSALPMPLGVAKKFGTIRIASTVAFTPGSTVTLTLTAASPLNNVGTFCNTSTNSAAHVTTPSGIQGQLTLGAPMVFNIPAACPTAAAASNLVAESPCAGAANGSALITLTGSPNPSAAITYKVDGGTTQNATMSAGTFTVSNLSAGSHVVSVTYPSCTAISTSSFTIGAGTPLTTTGSATVTACDSYLWTSASGGTGLTYTTSGTYTKVTGCNTATLTLTINNSTTGTTNATACDTYTWVAPLGNGQTYTTSGTYTSVTTNAAGCNNTQTLVLTINNSTAGTTTATACNTYTWAAPLGNGQTYTTSGTYTSVTTNAAGCNNTQTLVLTINNSTTGTTTATACDTYTWAGPLGNGTAYTTSGTYTNVTTNAAGCTHTQTLVLTINNSDAHTTTTSACDTYTWAAPLGNGQTYTASTTVSNTSTNASGCSHVETLVLTINNSSTSSQTVTACNTYTWSVNGQTYTASGTYTATNTNASGCPNAATLILTINSNTTPYYTDADGDGYGTGTAIFSCTGQPAGTALVSGDCAPNDPAKWQTANLYVDADNDGYYNGNPETTAVCYGATLPSGYTSSIIGTDCNDSNAEVNPNHVEVAGNTIDDNCDGTVDEVGPAIGIVPSQCGTTLSNVAATVYSQQATGAEGYRFEVTNGASVRTYDSTTNSFSLLSLAGGVTYGTTYAIRVAVKTSGFWRQYSAACNITTPSAAATTNVIASQCGVTLSNIDTTIYANQVTAANQYRFEVTDIATSTVRTFDTALNRFSLSNLSGGGAFGATYSIRVALRFGTTWEPYGTACNVSTPATPGVTSLQASQCNITVSNRWTTIYATQVPSAQGYRFRVTNGATVRFVDRVPANFALGQLTGAPLTPNTVYTVEVAVLYNSVYGAFGPACTLTTAGVITRHADAPVAIFEVKSYPNPFADTFKLDINTSSDANVGVKVYDMIGKLVESRDINVSELGTVEVGSRYSSGVYNVIVSQGENVQTLRVIKR